MLILGITGNIACGKSTVDAMLLTMGATEVIDADRTVHHVLRDDREVRAALLQAFSPRYLPRMGWSIAPRWERSYSPIGRRFAPLRA